MDPRTFTPGGVLVVAALTLTGCGIQGSDALSKDELIERADAVCQATNDELEPVFEQIWVDLEESGGSEADLEALMFTRWDTAMDTAAPVMLRQVDDLRELDPPEADEDLIETMLDDLETAINDFDALVNDAVAGDDNAKEALDGDDPAADVDRRAREYGFEVCGAEG